MKVKADLHIHSCLSPCGSLEMSPSLIAGTAARLGIGIAAITDHNSALNCRTFETCCRRFDILPIFGIEVTTIEEAHVLCLFETHSRAEKLGSLVYERLPAVKNRPENFGDQVFVDADENILGVAEKYLVGATDISLEELFDLTEGLDGMFIPAHIDRPVFSIPSQLGFLPGMDYTAVETTVLPCPVDTGNYPVLMSSDAHYPDDIASRYSILDIDSLSFYSVRNAVKANQITLQYL